MHDICFMGSRCSKNIKDWDGRNSSLSSACRARPLPWLVLPRFRKEPTEDDTCSGLPGSMKPIGLLGQRWAASSVRFYPSTSKDSLAQVAAVAFTILIHVWKRNMMWSIAAGTLCYMLLNSQFYTFFQPIFRPLLTLFQLFDDIINQNSLSARVCRKAQHFIGTLQYF
ncbi:AzlD domain-containing protein [Prevotella sp. LCP21S3_D2]|uniref:AzlD domain-containing protein n=1 Tax=Prevotella sp. LCP21S3_D2 TaxID=3438800 RepID=UPI003F969DE3